MLVCAVRAFRKKYDIKTPPQIEDEHFRIICFCFLRLTTLHNPSTTTFFFVIFIKKNGRRRNIRNAKRWKENTFCEWQLLLLLSMACSIYSIALLVDTSVQTAVQKLRCTVTRMTTTTVATTENRQQTWNHTRIAKRQNRWFVLSFHLSFWMPMFRFNWLD